MHGSAATPNPIVAALRIRRDGHKPLQVANGTTDDPGPQVVSEAPAEAVRAAWAATLAGQAVPMIGERGYAESCLPD